MQIATNIKRHNDFGFQIIFNESGMVIGINLICGEKILVKHRFSKEIEILNPVDENKLVNEVLADYILSKNTKHRNHAY